VDKHNLIKIGRFGYNFKIDGTFELRVNSYFQTCFLSINEFFIVIDDEKIRFVVIDNLTLKGNRLTGRLHDPGVITELKKGERAWLAIDSETYDSLTSFQEELIGLDLIYQDKKIGIVTDVFDNRAQDVLVVTLDDDEKSIMIPDVAEYVVSKDYDLNRVIVKNIQGLIDL